MSKEKESWLTRLQDRWNLKSGWQVAIVLIVFACTGFTVLFLKKPLFRLIHASEEYYTLLTILYYILILPIYNLILLFYGFIFGQFNFFWEFEKRMFRRFSGKRPRQ
ncbi:MULTISPECIES: DUF6787 family protein [unclassified Imperialibacter]|uniref:DUF6787 family protein n=1 Tax=unclassified Imperialibacter TaxID=2629706 RepID=UPI00125F70AF|nr:MULTISPECIES: DUF6787 family protein [unclassified Imperialibacter]CAD5298451.1 Prolipoprotein diacylglyceryl transferase [Imperialibacter sp. 89]